MKRMILLKATVVAILTALLLSCSGDNSVDPISTTPDNSSDNSQSKSYPVDHPAGVAAKAYAEEHLADYGLREGIDRVEVRAVAYGSDDRFHVFLDQYYYDVAVEHAYLLATLDTNLIVRHVIENVVSDVEVNTTNDITSDAAFQIAMRHYGIFAPEETVTAIEQLVVYSSNGDDYLCWHFYLRASNVTATGEYLIDAHNGEFLRSDITDITGGGEL